MRQANKKRMDKQFKVGDLVYLRLKNYKQTQSWLVTTKSFTKRFFGPYKILEWIGPVAYRLELRASSHVYPVFHVSLLKQSHSQNVAQEFSTKWITDTPTQTSIPKCILQRRQQDDTTTHLLIKWVDQNLSEATWEDEQDITLRFPDFKTGLPDESILEREGFVTTQQLPNLEVSQRPQAETSTRPKRVIKRLARFLE